MKFSIYGRFDIEVCREQGQWRAYRCGQGLRRLEPSLYIPAELNESEIIVYLDDVFHEYATPDAAIRQY